MPKATKRKKTEPNVEKFKERLRNELKRQNDLGITQKAISERAGIGGTTLSNWKSEKNTIMPSVYELSKLANALEVNLEWLAGMTEEKTPDKTLAATGLSAEAIENLIAIEKIKKPTSLEKPEPLYKVITSQIIQSKYFSQLVENFFYLKNHAEYVSTLTKFVNDGMLFSSPPDPPEVLKDYRHTLYEFADQLKYERYAVAETALKMLDDIASIEKALKEAETALDGYEPFDEYEMKGDDNGETTE